MDQLDDGVASDPTKARPELSLEEQESVTVQAELSSVLEESVESLSAAVGGWRSELARSSERSSRLEATIASLSAAMETWKTEMARTGARAEERLLRALEILESRMAQSQAISGEIRESLGSSASWLTRAMEEWKAEIRYGSGLTEVRLLSAIESLEGRVGQVEEIENQTRAHLENRTAEIGRNLEDRLQTVKAVQDETREWLEAAATAMGNDAQSALGRLRELGGAVNAFRGEMRQKSADDRALASESDAAQAALIDEAVRSLSEAQSASSASVKEAVTRAVATGMADAQSASAQVRDQMEAAIASLKGSVEEWKSSVDATSTKSETRLLRALEALEEGISQTRDLGSEIQNQITESTSALSTSLSETRTVVDRASGHSEEMIAKGLSELEGKIVDALADRLSAIDAAGAESREGLAGKIVDALEMRLALIIAAGAESREGLEGKIVNALEERLSAIDAAGAESREGLEGKIVNALEDRLALMIAAGAESRVSLEDLISKLNGSIQEWHSEVGKKATITETKLVRSLEALESGIADNATGRQEIENGLLVRLEDLETKLSRNQQEGEERQERIESSVMALTQSIDDWRNKGRESAGRTKERISQSLEALENRILESREDEADHRDRMRIELGALTDAVENLGSSGRDHATVMRGLEELDEGLLRNRDDVANLSETFEAQFGIFESRVGDAVAARIASVVARIEAFSARIDDLEHNIQERNKALVTLVLGPRADADALPGIEAPGPRKKPTDGAAKTVVEPPAGQQARRRR